MPERTRVLGLEIATGEQHQATAVGDYLVVVVDDLERIKTSLEVPRPHHQCELAVVVSKPGPHNAVDDRAHKPPCGLRQQSDFARRTGGTARLKRKYGPFAPIARRHPPEPTCGRVAIGIVANQARQSDWVERRKEASAGHCGHGVGVEKLRSQ